MAKIHRLQIADKIKAVDWLRAAGERLKSERPTYPELCVQLKEVLGVTVMPGSAADLVKLAGVAWEPRQQHRVINLKALARDVAILGRRLDEVVLAIRSLSSALGYPTWLPEPTPAPMAGEGQ